MLQQLFETARDWATATEGQVEQLKQIVSRIVGYKVELLRCVREQWLSGAFDLECQIYVHSRQPCRYYPQSFELLDHLVIYPEDGFVISQDYANFFAPSKKVQPN